MGTNMARCASWATGLFNKARSAALNRPVAKLAMSAIFSAHCVNKIIDYSFYITPRILMAKFKMIVICKSVLKLTQKFVQFVSSCKNPNQCLAVQCTLQSSSQGISRCFPRHSQFSVRYKNTFARHFLFRGFYLLSCGRVLYRTILAQLYLMPPGDINVFTLWNCLKIHAFNHVREVVSALKRLISV